MAPPPPPMCLPFTSKPRRRLSWSSSAPPPTSPRDTMTRRPSESPTPTIRNDDDDDDDRLTFKTDSEKWDVPQTLPEFQTNKKGKPSLKRSNTMTGTKKSTKSTAKSTGGSSKWGYGWGIGKKQKEKELEAEQTASMTSETNLPLYEPPMTSSPPSNPPTRSNSQSTQASRSTQRTHTTQRSQLSQASHGTIKPDLQRGDSQRSHASNSTARTLASKVLPPTPGSSRPHLYPNDSSSTLVGSALERKMNETDSFQDDRDTIDRLEKLRELMAQQTLDYYVIPNEDAHGSEIVADSDQRRQYITLFYGSSGDAVVTMNNAYLFIDARYWVQAKQSVDRNWTVVRAGDVGQPKDWMDWIVGRAQASRIGIDGRMISHEKAQLLSNKLDKSSKLVFPTQNLIDLVWKDKPQKSKAPIYLQPIEFTGVSAHTKIMKLREWIRAQPPSVPSYSKTPATPQQMQVGTLISSLSAIAYLLNIRGSDIPHNPLFHAYLYVGLDKAVIFLDASKVVPETADYLAGLNVERKEYLELWTFLRSRGWGEGKILISPDTSQAISLMLTHYRYTVAPSYVDSMMAVKNDTELEGMKRAYLRDGASFVRFLAWLEAKLQDGYDITEWEAASRLTEFRRHNKHFMGIAYKSISATGSNAALPHYTPRKSSAKMIERDTPYLNDSGGQYRDGTCDTTRTVHFGRPTTEQCEAYTRVLQGHIAIDSAVFPEGTSGRQLDVLARKALWKDGMNYMHGTGHGFGSFLTVHEGPQSFTSDVALVPGHVITNEPGFYLEGKWGMRIESALAVRRVKTKNEFNGNVWLGFERLTCVPIQTRMVKDSMLTKEEKAWLKDHNSRCWDKLSPLLQDDKRALKWLKREAERGIGLAQGPGGLNIDWD